MRRWQAIPVAALAVFVVGAALFSTQYREVSAAPSAAPTTIEFALDCDPVTAGIQSSCTFPSVPTTTTVDIGVYIRNNGADTSVASFNFDVVTNQQATFNPAPANALDASNSNPDFNEAGFAPSTVACGLPAPNRDSNPSPTTADSQLTCFSGDASGATLLAGQTLLLGTVHYLVAADGNGTFVLANVAAGEDGGNEIGSCRPDITFLANCFDASVVVGSGATATPVNTATNTATATPACVPATATATPPAVGTPCATATDAAFVTVTPLVTPTLQPPATSPAGAASPVGENPPPATGPGGAQPGGNAGAGGARPIRLPDTGSRADGTNWSSILLIALAALAAGGLAGGAYLGTVKVSGARRRGDED